ncbi:hypothetical protein [Sulfurimonas sp.]
MKRRKFIQLSAITAISIQSSVGLSGCGSSRSKSTDIQAITADDAVRSISNIQTSNDALHTKVSQSTVSLLDSTSSVLFTKFQDNSLTLKPNLTDLYFPQNELWSNYKDAHSLAYKQANSQLTKLKATLRVYGYKQSTAEQIARQKVAFINTPAQESALNTFLQAIEDFKNLKFGAVAIDGLTLSIKLVFVVLEAVQNSTSGTYLLSAVLSALQGILEFIEQKALSNLSFSSDKDVVVSISKMAIAIISVQALSNIPKAPSNGTAFQTSLTNETTAQDIQTRLETLALQSQLIMTLISIVNAVMNKVLSATQTLASNVTNSNYELTQEDNQLISSLKPLSEILALLRLIIKVLLTYYQNNIASASESGALEADAQNYASLFGNPISAYDTKFSQFTSENFDTLFASNPEIVTLFNELGIDIQNFSFQTQPDAAKATAQAESDSFNFASSLSSLNYQFSPETSSQASDFATHLADLAYQFTMKIENDAYTFAMKGMEYGYLFASKGEEVGLMADRILWMAVQIGQMADRIGEMADRIVYTEQLIVYTEMLILDFGILIYGTIKQITNFMLMGMAIVFDRQWYAQVSQEDPVLNIISDMTTRMLRNMQQYEEQVLANQLSLREITLKALDWIDGEY